MKMVPPVARAWRRFQPGSPDQQGFTVLKETSRSLVCRLEGVGPDGSNIVAKRRRQPSGDRESFIYKEILERLPIETIRCYGYFLETEEEFGWLFLEDGGTVSFSERREDLRNAFARWLGILHSSASKFEASQRLPNRGPAHYLETLQSARVRILERLDHPAMTCEARGGMKRLLTWFEVLEQAWGRIEKRCDALPWTLVHGDLQGKNILTRSSNSGIVFLPVDWEDGGWGPPAADLGGIDCVSYWSAVREIWPCVRLDQVKDQIDCGSLFKILTAVGWATDHLVAAEKAIRHLQFYEPSVTTSALALSLRA